MSSSTPASASPERRHRALGRLARSRLALVGLAIVGLTALVGVLAPLVVTADPVAMDFGALLRGAEPGAPAGDGSVRRDVLARLVGRAGRSASAPPRSPLALAVARCRSARCRATPAAPSTTR
jgi:hypothetical protein